MLISGRSETEEEPKPKRREEALVEEFVEEGERVRERG